MHGRNEIEIMPQSNKATFQQPRPDTGDLFTKHKKNNEGGQKVILYVGSVTQPRCDVDLTICLAA
jgi:hypothetical protein